MNRIVLANLSSVQGLNKGEMKATVGGQFIGIFPNWYPRCTKRIGFRLLVVPCKPFIPVLH